MNNGSLLVEVKRDQESFMTQSVMTAAGIEFEWENLFEDPIGIQSAGEEPETVWRLATPRSTEPDLHPWDLAHTAKRSEFFDSHRQLLYMEPDIDHPAVPDFPDLEAFFTQAAGQDIEPGKPPKDSWPWKKGFAWHLENDCSQLKSARVLVGDPQAARVRIAILDSGYDPDHVTLPAYLAQHLEANFVENNNSARHPRASHGTGTLGILAGNKVSIASVSESAAEFIDAGWDDYLGGAPFAEIVPVRIQNSVVHLKTSTMAKGIAYTLAPRGSSGNRCDVVSISMGGLPSKAWARAVNDAYDGGVIIVAAAGNHFGKLTPSKLVWPARFRRVIAACGATANKTPYYKRWNLTGMQGNFGPTALMDTAMAAYTPNIPWARIGTGNRVDLDGAGTSSATPQIAAAAALWLQHYTDHPRMPQGAARVEAVRKALFEGADDSQAGNRKYFGRGILRARASLDIEPDSQPFLQPEDRVSFPLFRLLTGIAQRDPVEREMLEVEAAQLTHRHPELEVLLGDEEAVEDLDRREVRELVGAMAEHPDSSHALRTVMEEEWKNWK